MKLFLRVPRLEKVREALRSRTGALRGGTRLLPRREILFIALAAAASVIVTLIVLTVSFNARERRALAHSAEQTSGAASAQSPGTDAVTADDFVLPAPPAPGAVPDFYPFRPRLLQWSRENVEKFWVSPRRIAADAIGVLNDRNMEGLFQKVK
ncbi:MAG TPA: hypothetical protein VL359_12900 [bacterium]|nr:hypothetical protein [bacterium]